MYMGSLYEVITPLVVIVVNAFLFVLCQCFRDLMEIDFGYRKIVHYSEPVERRTGTPQEENLPLHSLTIFLMPMLVFFLIRQNKLITYTHRNKHCTPDTFSRR